MTRDNSKRQSDILACLPKPKEPIDPKDLKRDNIALEWSIKIAICEGYNLALDQVRHNLKKYFEDNDRKDV